MKKVVIIDTSVLCCWIGVQRKETCGTDSDVWDKSRVDSELSKEIKEGATFVLPLASIIETGNHIAQAPEQRYEHAQVLAELINQAADHSSPWAAFTDQSTLWNEKGLKDLAKEWPKLADSKFSIGDATIKNVAEYYAQMGNNVEILTGDARLKAYQPAVPIAIPRRKRHRSHIIMREFFNIFFSNLAT